jgi:hypothetical protein
MNATDEEVILTDLFEDLPMPDVRRDWKQAAESNSPKGCGLHKNFTYDELCELEV